LTTLSDAAAESFSKFKGHMLGLKGLTSLSDTAIKSFRKFPESSLYLSPLLEKRVQNA
jgi:hypothetical protein